MEVVRRQYPAEILATRFFIQGKIDPFGQLWDVLSDPDTLCVPVTEATITPLGDGPVKPFSLSESYVAKEELLFIYLTDPEDREGFRVFVRTLPVILYLPDMVLNGQVHVGGETRIRDWLDTTSGLFFPVSEVEIFALRSLPIRRRYERIWINKKFVLLYHAPEG